MESKSELKKEANNFLSDALVLIQELNKASGKELSKEEKSDLLEKLDEFSTSFIYFRESYDESKSKIHQLTEAIEQIREVSATGEAGYENAPDQESKNAVLLSMISEIMDKLETMNGLIEHATIEESQNRQLNGIKEIFVETKKDILGTENALRDVHAKIELNSDHLKDSMESVEKNLRIFEKNVAEIKSQYDAIKLTETTILEAFKRWEVASGPEIERGFSEIFEKIEMIVKTHEEKQVDKISKVDDCFNQCMASFKTKSDEVLDKISAISQKSDNLLTGEGIKQFMVYGGTALSGLNLILLLLLLFFK